jgi:hypothetical protein
MYDIAQSIVSSLIEKLQLIDGKAFRRWAILIVGGGVTIFGVLNFSFIYIGVNHPPATSARATTAITTSSSSGEGGFINVFGVGIVPRKTSSVTASFNGYSSTILIEVPWIGFVTRQIDIQLDTDVDKVSGYSPECTTYNETTQKVLSYSCINPKLLTSSVIPNAINPFWQNKIETSLPEQSRDITPFKGGVLAINPDRTKPLYYSNSDGVITYLRAPKDLDYNDLIFSSLTANSLNPEDDTFLISTPNGDVYRGSLSDNDSYAKFPRLKDFSRDLNTSSCSLGDLVAYCYFGKGRSASSSKINDSVLVMKFLNDKISYERFFFNTNTPIDNLYVTSSGTLFGVNDRTLLLLKRDSGSIKPQVIATDVSGVAAGSGLSYIKNNSVYSFNESKLSASLQFTSPLLDVTRVDSFGGTQLLTAKVKGTTFYQKYKLNNQPREKNGVRLVDTIPLVAKDFPEVIKSDYFNNTIGIQVVADISSDKRTGTTSYNEVTFAENKELVLEKLATLGIDPKGFEIVFTK